MHQSPFPVHSWSAAVTSNTGAQPLAFVRGLLIPSLSRRDGAPQAAGLKNAVEFRLNWVLERGERRRALAERGRAPGGGAVGPADGQRRGRGHGERGCRFRWFEQTGAGGQRLNRCCASGGAAGARPCRSLGCGLRLAAATVATAFAAGHAAGVAARCGGDSSRRERRDRREQAQERQQCGQRATSTSLQNCPRVRGHPLGS